MEIAGSAEAAVLDGPAGERFFRSQWYAAMQLWSAGEESSAIAVAASLVRADPGNRSAASLLGNLLSERRIVPRILPLPVGDAGDR